MPFKIRSCAFLAIIIIALSAAIPLPVCAKDSALEFVHARPSVNGALHVEGTRLVDEAGNPVMLRGVSSHGLTWFSGFIRNDIFEQLSTDWDCNLIRLPLYSDIYSKNDREGLDVLKKGIEYAVANDMYVIVDWHILEDKDPNTNIGPALEFFSTISQEYSGVPNIIYEICNEPNGETFWDDICKYANNVIPVIRMHAPDALILVGTPNYDRALTPAVNNPLKYDKVMYVLHFYAASHKRDLQEILRDAVERGLPVFVSECGLSESTGDGYVDFKSAVDWFSILDDYGISYAVWSLSNKNESSAFLYPIYDEDNPITDEDLTSVGCWVRELIRGQSPSEIPVVQDSKQIKWLYTIFDHNSLEGMEEWPKVAAIILPVIISGALLCIVSLSVSKRKHKTYFQKETGSQKSIPHGLELFFVLLRMLVLSASIFFSLAYLYWRAAYSIPFESGALAVVCNIILLVVEVIGFFESLVLYIGLIRLKNHPLPEIAEDEYPEVDIFISTYNEPEELLEKTINACNHLIYPDSSKVHIWLCDDNRRAGMRDLAGRMKVGYFDRPDNEGAKAGNLNHAMSLTGAPIIVTLDSDMIVRSDFLMKTVPYFVKAWKDEVPLGLLQTPQCFYEPDVFQYALYSEKNAPNEQDFFYRTIEVAKTSSNSVIYGGSNTLILRKALEDVDGFYTGSITEDFATGLLIEAEGYVSLALPEPLASGKTPDTFRDHIKQRIRWGRGVISTSRKLHIFSRKGLSIFQKISYWSSVEYWYSPIKNLVYMLAPLMYSLFGIPVFKCTFVDLMVYWLPMFLMQDICLRTNSKNAISLKWSGIYETSVMPFLLVPTVKELFGISTSVFAVTDKSGKAVKRETDLRAMLPFLILILLSVISIVRIIFKINGIQSVGFVVLAFWILRNMYFLIMSVFLIDGRVKTNDGVTVVDAEPVVIKDDAGNAYEGVTTNLTEHSLKIYLDKAAELKIGDRTDLLVTHGGLEVCVYAVVTGITGLKNTDAVIYLFEILDYKDNEGDYLEVIYDRVPSLPQSLTRDFGLFTHLIRVVAYRILR